MFIGALLSPFIIFFGAVLAVINYIIVQPLNSTEYVAHDITMAIPTIDITMAIPMIMCLSLLGCMLYSIGYNAAIKKAREKKVKKNQ
jgi:hypothetical protein